MKIYEEFSGNRRLDKIIPKEQASFRPNKGCIRKVLALTTHIENGFQKRLKTFVVFVDLTATYDTIWKEGLLLWKLMKIIPCKKTISFVKLNALK